MNPDHTSANNLQGINIHPGRLPNPLPTHNRSRVAAYIFGIYVLVTLLIAGGCWILIQQDKARQEHTQTIQLTSLARAFQEYMSRSFSEADFSLAALRNDMNNLAGQPVSIQARSLREKATRLISERAQIAALAVYSFSAGEAIIVRQRGTPQNVTPPRPAAPNLATGLTFQILSPIRETGGKWYLPIYLGMRPAHGSDWGGVSALINLEYIAAYYQDIRLSTDDKIHLIDSAGRLLISFPTPEVEIGYPLLPTDKLPPEKVGSNTVQARVSINGQSHVGAFSKLREYPLIIGASRSLEVAEAEFLEMRRRLILASAALITMLGALSWLIYYDIGRREVSRQALGNLNTSLEERVRQRTSELEQSNRELVAFSYSVSHDLRAPLRAINGFAHALKEDNLEQLDPQGREYLDRIYRASVRMGELIDELLSLANVSRAPLKHRTINLADIAREIVEDLRIASPDRAIEFHAPEKLLAEGDEALLRNALSNLLNNAWKFTRARRPAIISLSAEEDAEKIRYVVEDNGIGFDMAHSKRLFQPFQQLHANQGFGGTGIGLASVRRIIERHGGQIWAESSPDAGARFIFVLPRHASVLRRRERTSAYS